MKDEPEYGSAAFLDAAIEKAERSTSARQARIDETASRVMAALSNDDGMLRSKAVLAYDAAEYLEAEREKRLGDG